MDPRRFVTLAGAGLALGACTTWASGGPGSPVRGAPGAPALAAHSLAAQGPQPAAPQTALHRVALIDPGPLVRRPVGRAAPPAPGDRGRRRQETARLQHQAPSILRGAAAIAAANRAAREISRPGRFRGGVQVFTYAAGRIYEVWTAPLRVTTLTLAPGETLISKAAGDTVRWQIGETTSGAGAAQTAHVMVKPLRRGLETNLTLSTSERVYLIALRSGGPDAFNTEVAWETAPARPEATGADAASAAAPPALAPAPASPQPPSPGLDARYRVEPAGRRPAWTPLAVFTDGIRTYLSFPPGLAAQEAPALFVAGPDGPQLVNYRQRDGLWVVDQVLDRAELRLGDHRPQVVRIIRAGGGGGG